MKIDFDHYLGSQIANDINNNLDLERKLSIISSLNPSFSIDGDQFCYLYGSLPNQCIVGFGETAYSAMVNFCDNFFNSRPPIYLQSQSK